MNKSLLPVPPSPSYFKSVFLHAAYWKGNRSYLWLTTTEWVPSRIEHDVIFSLWFYNSSISHPQCATRVSFLTKTSDMPRFRVGNAGHFKCARGWYWHSLSTRIGQSLKISQNTHQARYYNMWCVLKCLSWSWEFLIILPGSFLSILQNTRRWIIFITLEVTECIHLTVKNAGQCGFKWQD